MGVELLTERHKDQIAGLLSCYDRIIIQGTVPGWCYASGNDGLFLRARDADLRLSEVGPTAAGGASRKHGASRRENGIEIEFVRSRKSFRKEDRVKQVLSKRGEHPGVVCILSAMEPCGSYKPWHDRK